MTKPQRTCRTVFQIWVALACWSSCRALPAAESIEDVLSATFRLTDRKTSATCFVVERDVKTKSLALVTAAHFFEQVVGDECWVDASHSTSRRDLRSA